MTETYNYWLSLLQSGKLEDLEMEIKEEVFKMTPYLEPEDIPDVEIDEAYNIAQGYNYE